MASVTFDPSNGPAARVLQVVLQLDAGGTERLVIELVRRLQDRFPTSVCCLDEPGSWGRQLADEGVQVTALGRAPGFHPGLAWKLADVAARFNATVMHCHHYSPFVYGTLARLRLPRVRIVFTEHGRLSDAPPSRKRRLANRFLMMGSPAVYAVSHDLRRHLVAEGYPERTGVIWNGIEPGVAPDEDARRHARRLMGLADGVKVVGTVARLDPVKDLGTLLQAVAIVRREVACRLVVVGDGPAREALKLRARALHIEDAVDWLGQRDDVRELLPGFDVYANSSISEGISLTLLEAMAAELPVVATDVGGSPEVVEDGQTGALCPARSPDALGSSLQRIFGDARLAADYGRAGRSRVCEHFTLDRMVARYAELYENSADGRKQAAEIRRPEDRSEKAETKNRSSG